MFALQSLQNYLAFHLRRHLRKQQSLMPHNSPTVLYFDTFALSSLGKRTQVTALLVCNVQFLMRIISIFFLFFSFSNEFCTLDLESGKYLPQTVQFGLQYPAGKGNRGEVFREVPVVCQTYQQSNSTKNYTGYNRHLSYANCPTPFLGHLMKDAKR